MILSTLIFGLSTALALASDPELLAFTPQGIYLGTCNSTSAVESWLGIRYAQPPVTELRFRAPQPLTRTFAGVQNASTFGNACLQAPRAGLGAPIAEDCLFLNIWRPQNTPRDARLPVLVWFHGGRYTTGAGSDPAFNPSRILQRSTEINKPIIFVTIYAGVMHTVQVRLWALSHSNSRMNTFGFLATSLLPVEDLNAGLQDQAEALRFLRANIAAFGGGPSKVTLWGQVDVLRSLRLHFSKAGAGGVLAHIVHPQPGSALFRAALANSETGPFKYSPPPETYDAVDKPFRRLLDLTQCPFGPKALTYLRGLPSANASRTLLTPDPSVGQVWQPTISPSGSFAFERASVRIREVKFLKIPSLAGTVVSTSFASPIRGHNLTGQAEDTAFTHFIRSALVDATLLTPETISTIHHLYPANDTTLGGRFNTGDSLFDRAAAWYTDTMFPGPRRMLWEQAAERGQRVWGFYYQELSGNDRTRGISHSSELPMFFGPVPSSTQLPFANQLLDSYITFVTHLNPGPAWPMYTKNKANVLQLIQGNVALIPDDFDQVKTDFLNSEGVLRQFQK
ncbi:Alpha/Beta hydrolase protein [Pterulicium gracile]|uniref:Alpha/Beta hydrolase protein n=1 Tax=Pterulicium gracile TaxID=1884261 RepID=A0A5C3QS10_9AGAR|nr:Alpha/Beta hydrolase protein [Pterula gracilis]